MGRSGGIYHSKLPPDSVVSPRSQDRPIRAEDEDQFSSEFLAKGLGQLREALGDIARQAENRSFPVDEYNTASITGAATESTVNVLPTYEMMPEKIEAVVVVGPPATSITLILGDRQWPLIIPVSGILVIGPLSLILGRNDPRQIVSATPGIFSLEVMGIADKRFG